MIRFAITSALVIFNSFASANPIYKLDGKTVEYKNLSPAAQTAFFEADMRAYESKKQVIDNEVIDQYINEKAAKAKKPAAEVEAEEFKVKDPSDKELKTFFEQNKERIPYKYDDVKPQIKELMMNNLRQEKRTKLLAKLKDKKFAFEMAPPVAPKFDIPVAGFPVKGPDSAKVTIVEFADYQCPHCKAAHSTIKTVMEKFKDKVKLIYIDFPVNPSGISRKVSEGAYCAMQQKKYWEFHDKAFHTNVSNDSPISFAKELSLNEDEFKKCFEGQEAKNYVNKGKELGEKFGVSGTPAVFINGERSFSHTTAESLTEAIKAKL